VIEMKVKVLEKSTAWILVQKNDFLYRLIPLLPPSLLKYQAYEYDSLTGVLCMEKDTIPVSYECRVTERREIKSIKDFLNLIWEVERGKAWT
jgi:hypothetical protein